MLVNYCEDRLCCLFWVIAAAKSVLDVYSVIAEGRKDGWTDRERKEEKGGEEGRREGGRLPLRGVTLPLPASN